ncbi:heterokaryon incompatibility protein-domain-containing protein [Hypoxylon rubiginosum]|uniref:Heterokaryon incompatibility protein-domain-containing protein n=1 Tax=Hypoxylon rubiginosum TaxID=110542 RepID=A0ACC0CPQ7_9PEZI|nr:heterokaryon incompatibility protein-domain-containing protein [Hypoxylon rubiginosum]
MSLVLPSRLLAHVDGKFFVFDPRTRHVDNYDIISYRWGDRVAKYDCSIGGVEWDVEIPRQKLEDIKRLMVTSGTQYLWADCVCINQADEREKAFEIARMYEYYKSARRCHILIDMVEVWNPQDIVDDLKFVDHMLFHIGSAALASEARLTENLNKRLWMWANDKEWAFDLDKSIVRSAGIELGLINCYATRIGHVRSLFHNLYFSRVWTFQEMLLGKNITMWGINDSSISFIGELDTWMDLATDSKDKAYKLQAWIENSRVLNTTSVKAILRIIDEDKLSLSGLQIQVSGISSARTDILNGGAGWWYGNHKGISNVFSAVSIRPRVCGWRADIFRGLLGVFSGLFSPEEIATDMTGDDMEKISFAFFKQLSRKTGRAWTKLAISSGERERWDWIPVTINSNRLMTTDCFAGVVDLGRLNPKQEGLAKTMAMTGLQGTPRKYMRIQLSEGNGDFRFVFKGCNVGKSVKTGTFSSEPIPRYDNQPRDIVRDETGGVLVQCATILGGIMDPGTDLIAYRKRMLGKLCPNWRISDPNAKPTGWIDRCVSGTFWGSNDTLQYLRVHNRSMNYRMVDITGCESRLQNESTETIVCHVSVACGCTIVAPFSLIFEAVTAMEGSFLGDTAAALDEDNRIVLRDGLGLVQVGDVGKAFHLVAFQGDVDAHKSHSDSCRSTKLEKVVVSKLPWPKGRALVREDFKHSATDVMRDYGYKETGGTGNLLISRNHPIDDYRIVGVCIDEHIPNKKGNQLVTIR